MPDHPKGPSSGASPPNRGDEYTFSVSDFGIDTLVLSFRYFDSSKAQRTLSCTHTIDINTGEVIPIITSPTTQSIRDPSTGTLFLLHSLPTGEKLLKANTRLSALLNCSRGVRALAAPRSLQEAPNALVRAGERLGLIESSPGYMTVGRIDLSTDVFFQNARDSQAFLTSLACLDLPRCKSRPTRGLQGRLETVEWFQKKGTLVRGYDKTAESLEGRRQAWGQDGVTIRLERQLREPKSRQAPVQEMHPQRLGQIFTSTFRRWHETQIEVVPRSSLLEKILSLASVEAPPISLAKAERMIGTAAVITAGADAVYTPRILNERLADFRRLGIEIGTDVTTPFALGDAVDEFLRPWSAYD